MLDGTGIFDAIPKALWNEVLDKTDRIKSIPNTEIYSTLIANTDKTGYGVKKTSSFFEKESAGEDPNKYYGYYTHPSKLKERFLDIINKLREMEEVDLGKSYEGIVNNIANYDNINSIIIGTEKISKTEAENRNFIQKTRN